MNVRKEIYKMTKKLGIFPIILMRMFLMGCNSDLAQRVEDLEKREVLLKECIEHITFGIEHTHPLEYPYLYEFSDNPKVFILPHL